MKRFLSFADIEAEYGLKQKTQRNWRALSQGPPAFKVNGLVLVERSELEAWLQAHRDDGHSTEHQAARATRRSGG